MKYKKIAILSILIALILSFFACSPEANNKDKTEDGKTAISFSLSFVDVKKPDDFSLEIEISKEKTSVGTIKLSSSQPAKVLEVEEGAYGIQYVFLSNGEYYNGKDYECRIYENIIEVKKGEKKEVSCVICPVGYDPGEPGATDTGEPRTGKLVIDLGNYFKKAVSYVITPSSPNETILGTIQGNTVIDVPIGNTSVTFSVKDDNNYIIRTGNSAVDLDEYTFSNFFVDTGSESLFYIYVYKKTDINPDKPVLIFNPTEGSELLMENNEYGENVKIVCTVTRYTDRNYDVTSGKTKEQSFTSDSFMELDSDGYYNILFKVSATKQGVDVSYKYEVTDDTGYSGNNSYVGKKYDYYNLKITRKD